MKKLIVLIMAVVLTTASATIINIPDDYATIQAGIDASSDGDTVLVGPGAYVENINFNGHNIVLGSLFLTTGDTSHISQTAIDGDSMGCVVTFENGETGSAVICGFTIQNGLGGGTHNNWIGGGVTCKANSNPIVRNNIITRNSSPRGGGVNCQYCSPLIENNTIIENSGLNGVGIWCGYENTNPEIANNVIRSNNSGGSGGGIYLFSRSEAFVHDNEIAENSVYSSGGGIYCDQWCAGTIHNNMIYGNQAYYGGGIDCEADDLSKIYFNTITNNSAGFGGGIAVVFSSNPAICNNLIVNNDGDRGGGIYLDNTDCNPQIINNTISLNECQFGGGGIWFGEGCEPILVNTIIWDNFMSGVSDNIGLIGPENLTNMMYCDINEEFAGEGNIALNPCFRDTAANDFHLMSIGCGDPLNSPCIDTGNPALRDSLLGCFWGQGSELSDMGAFGGNMRTLLHYIPGDANMYIETWPPAVIGSDVTYLVNFFRGVQANRPCLLDGFYCSADINGDCSVIGSDVTRLVNYFRGQAEIAFCPDYQTAWPSASLLPSSEPTDWPFCEESPLSAITVKFKDTIK